MILCVFGMVGVVLFLGVFYVGFIVDGIYVDFVMISLVLCVNKGFGEIFFVIDVMVMIGLDLMFFIFNGCEILRLGDCFIFVDGILVGVYLVLVDVIKFLVFICGEFVEIVLKWVI